jgi:hypothetical protein
MSGLLPWSAFHSWRRPRRRAATRRRWTVGRTETSLPRSRSRRHRTSLSRSALTRGPAARPWRRRKRRRSERLELGFPVLKLLRRKDRLHLAAQALVLGLGSGVRVVANGLDGRQPPRHDLLHAIGLRLVQSVTVLKVRRDSGSRLFPRRGRRRPGDASQHHDRDPRPDNGAAGHDHQAHQDRDPCPRAARRKRMRAARGRWLFSRVGHG